MKYLLMFLFVVQSSGVFAQTSKPQWSAIKAFLPGWNGAQVILRLDRQTILTDTIRKDMFSYNISKPISGHGEISVTDGKRTEHLRFFLEPGTVRIGDAGNKFFAFGTPLNDRYREIEKQWDAEAAGRIYGIKQVKQFMQAKVTELVRAEPASEVSLRMLYDHFYLEPSVNDILYHDLFYSLSPGLHQTVIGKKMKLEVDSRYATAVGRPAPVLMLPDTKKQLQPLYQKGQYTLVHFWASWCAPCRKANESLRAIHRNDSSLVKLVGVSLDGNYSAWTSAIQKEELGWTQLNEINGWKGSAVKAYNVRSLPYNILIDPNGVIVARSVNDSTLKQILMRSAGTKQF